MTRSLSVNYRDVVDQSVRLEDLYTSLAVLEFTHQKLTAELIFLRLFSLLELHFQSIAMKVLCGAQYLDGTGPILLHTSTNAANALSNILSHGRANPIKQAQLKWSNSQSIQGNIGKLIDRNDNYRQVILNNSALIDDMRFVRNHIAHNNPDTRQKFSPVVTRYYGGYVNTVTPGVLLLSPRRTPCLLVEYIRSVRIIIGDLVKR